ncbi:hypothetical protein WJX72_010691 [[Myrmecia] bisecta]|uniref:Uncharacterized protein n=1 Tax=[Myrmecia] bisecta TaxID=41462 RepID=A0AAW1QB45_9CHLO
MEPVVSQKECRRCHTTKPAAEFHCCRTHSDGLDTYCKACQALISAERRQRQIRVDVPTVDHKICRQCAVDKPAGDFNRNRNNPDGLASYCRVCRAKNENVAGTATRYKRHVPEPPPQVTVPTEPGPVTAYTPRSASKMRRRKGPKSAMGDGGRQSQSTSPTSTGAAAPAQDTSPHARSLHSPGSVDAAGQSRADSEPSRLRRPRPVALRPVGGSLDATLLGGPQHTHRDPSWLPLGLHKRRLPQQGSGSVGDNDSGGGGSGGPPLKHGSGSGTLGSLNSGSSASAFRPYGPSPRSHPRKRVKGSGLASETRSDDPGSAASAETPITWKTGKARTPRSRLRVSRT